MSINPFFTLQTGAQSAAPQSQWNGKQGAATMNADLAFFDLFLQVALNGMQEKSEQSDHSFSDTDGASDMKGIISAESAEIKMDMIATELNNLEPGAYETFSDNATLTEDSIEVVDIHKNTDTNILPGSEVLIAEAEKKPALPLTTKSFLIDDESALSRPAKNNLHRIWQKIEQIIGSDDSQGQMLLTDMTPEQITALKDTVQNILNGQVQEQDVENSDAIPFDGVLIGLVNILPPKAKQDYVITGKSILITGAGLSGENDNAKALKQNLAKGESFLGQKNELAKLNALNVNTKPDARGYAPTPAGGEDFDDFEYNLRGFMKDAKSLKALGESDGLAAQKFGKGAGNGIGAGQGLANAPVNQGTQNAIQNGVLKNWSFSGMGGLLTSGEFTSSELNMMGLGAGGQAITSSLAAMTSLATQSHGAAHPHPGTQMVAMSMNKAAASGETRNITLLLDPPELGRVEVKMSFGKDSAIKAVLTIEKAETFVMLQRDAQILERALQEAGLETDENSLSFNLSQDNQDFSQDGKHDGSRNPTGQGEDNESDLETIETTMNWYIDPETGFTRYDIFA
ncbi:MAG: flagellar hook-length control protein FliK [Alphaproteobacteria bacterium]